MQLVLPSIFWHPYCEGSDLLKVDIEEVEERIQKQFGLCIFVIVFVPGRELDRSCPKLIPRCGRGARLRTSDQRLMIADRAKFLGGAVHSTQGV